MKNFFFQMIGLTGLILGATYLAFNYQILTPYTSQIFNNRPVVVPSGAQTPLSIVGSDGQTKAKLTVDISDDPDERSKGLGGRQSLASDSGMLFIHDNTQRYTYWMKGMEIPIDIIWVLDDTIVDFIANVQPPIAGQTDDTLERYASTVEVNRVLETRAGFIQTHNIQKGDKIVLERLQ